MGGDYHFHRDPVVQGKGYVDVELVSELELRPRYDCTQHSYDCPTAQVTSPTAEFKTHASSATLTIDAAPTDRVLSASRAGNVHPVGGGAGGERDGRRARRHWPERGSAGRS